VGEVIEPGYEWRPDRKEYLHTVKVAWDTTYAKDIPSQGRWALTTVDPVPSELYNLIMGTATATTQPVSVPLTASTDPLIREVEHALERKGQVILYGPPGTGKTHHARRFAVSWLLRKAGQSEEARSALRDAKAFAAAERRLTERAHPADVPALTFLTFHPSYSYEDFIEGYRPTGTDSGGLSLRLVDGAFKRVCQAAGAHPGQTYLVLIDEINRANVAKVFGEIITLLELDKRVLPVVLPQSQQVFSVPANVFVVGTMNTADRSIKLLDAALRRRFAFVELMPDPEVLRAARVGGLALDDFLEELNRRIAKNEGREKQIGHSFLMEQGAGVSDVEEFARRFRQEILPLLQEFCYDDYGALASYLGTKLVNREAQVLNQDLLADAEALVAALEDEFSGEGGGAE
jgi:5-methylcytosine-specific restriction protein B